ncbi:heavy-metal-associated domain-containing protein [Mucilaginibacter robiniae]|uniref:Heavy-metal-associated domain-containing protein n=1 Tax=Mucilaginibacter robiniae TaxID=2728022 RepID=A0A7L5DY01_9SPHI|nr:heavy metal-associated domain-containing protein [Mucilaginibacter robiniae]QJD95992.1 heavy-metal-associated domain-containing protein [Mucilaginibacter robiniae]
METLKFKTNIKCGGCIAAVTPSLNNLQGIEKWEVDTANPDKVLTVQAQESLSASEIITTLKEKGYKAEKI